MSFERTTPCGVISGTACQWPGIAAYKGIRYATAGRWEFPVPVTHWDGVYDATQYGACCYQPRAFYDEAAAPGKAFYYNEFRKGETYTYSEDCLFLNIWTPADAAPEDKLPVIFYIHGGGFTGGCGHEKHFDGPVWPTKGCVAVTINYRLGPMGFVCLPALADEAGSTGNYAFLDQLAALQWVRANIAAFGGDPNNITIMGQSAGAMSVQQLVLSPITRELFSKAVMSSGGGVSQMLTAKPAEAHYPFWKQVMEAAGCSTLAEFRALAPAQTVCSLGCRPHPAPVQGYGLRACGGWPFPGQDRPRDAGCRRTAPYPLPHWLHQRGYRSALSLPDGSGLVRPERRQLWLVLRPPAPR